MNPVRRGIYLVLNADCMSILLEEIISYYESRNRLRADYEHVLCLTLLRCKSGIFRSLEICLRDVMYLLVDSLFGDTVCIRYMFVFSIVVSVKLMSPHLCPWLQV